MLPTFMSQDQELLYLFPTLYCVQFLLFHLAVAQKLNMLDNGHFAILISNNADTVAFIADLRTSNRLRKRLRRLRLTIFEKGFM